MCASTSRPAITKPLCFLMSQAGHPYVATWGTHRNLARIPINYSREAITIVNHCQERRLPQLWNERLWNSKPITKSNRKLPNAQCKVNLNKNLLVNSQDKSKPHDKKKEGNGSLVTNLGKFSLTYDLSAISSDDPTTNHLSIISSIKNSDFLMNNNSYYMNNNIFYALSEGNLINYTNTLGPSMPS